MYTHHAAAAFPRLGGLDARYVAKQLEDYASGARPNAVMTPIALSLSQNDRRSLGLYYAGLHPQAPSRSASTPQTTVGIQAGAALYAVGSASLGIQACANCHGLNGCGLDPTYPAVAGQPSAYIAEQLRAFRAELRTNDVGSAMRSVAKTLGDADIEGLAAYLAALPP